MAAGAAVGLRQHRFHQKAPALLSRGSFSIEADLTMNNRKARRPLRRVAVAAVAAVAAFCLFGAGAAHSAALCRTVSHSEAVAIVLCEPKAQATDWRVAGAAACKGKAACNAWIWDDAAKAPQKAPQKDADMPKSQTGAARAVLVMPGGDLILVRKAP